MGETKRDKRPLNTQSKDSRGPKSQRPHRIGAPPKVSYPTELPITHRREEIVRAIKTHQVIILSGETGSGKTTQLPKMCIEAGRGTNGLIGCTQPRRIAALTVASRIAEELGNELLVGSKIRFHDSSSPENYIRVMTDGMLLAEAQGHPALRAYDTLIIDEAHERSLNIDVLLGMIRNLITKRGDLKVIITSATLDTQKFSRHFFHAPIIEVSGRTYPVEIRYEEPLEEDAGLSVAERCAKCILRLTLETSRGDILAFLPTEQDIRDTMSLVAKDRSDRLNIIPLFARLPSSEQKKAFITGGKRKLVVATNVAETSLTIPGIRYVVDSGLARISWYNPGTGTQGLPINPISKASAHQRAGRCGRVENGVCIRMYSQEDYLSRREYTPPEILRTNLAEVILSLLDLGITDIETFPFVDPPDPAGIRDGFRTLGEIGALLGKKGRDKRRLTKNGRLMARLPLNPRLARVLIEADREGCLGDVLPIAAALSLQDPRERPPNEAGRADTAHKVFQDAYSDFIGQLNIWDSFRIYRKKGSYSGKLKAFCKEHYLSFRRMREWMDVHRQLTLVMEDNGYRPKRTPGGPSVDKKNQFTPRYSAIHRSLLSGFLSHILRREEGGFYEATRNRKARIHPGSSLYKTDANWIMAAELVRTNRLYARSVAAIDSSWLEELGENLLVRSWIRPSWNRRAGEVRAEEQCRLFGFLVSQGRQVPYGPLRPVEAREIFIQSGLVEGDIKDVKGFGFLRANEVLLGRLRSMEDKLRRRDLVAGEDSIVDFYNQRLPPDVCDIRTLERHLRTEGDAHLRMTEEDMLTGVLDAVRLREFPDTVDVAGTSWKLAYAFDTDSNLDGVTLKIPAGRVSDLSPKEVDWWVPGLLQEKVEALMRALPKAYRRKLIPIPQTAVAAVEGVNRHDADLAHGLTQWLYQDRGIDIPVDLWNIEGLPDYLKIRFSLLNDAGRETASGRGTQELAKLRSYSGDSQHIHRYKKAHERQCLNEWPGDIPISVEIHGGALLWPALCDEDKEVALRYFSDRWEAEEQQILGQVKLAGLHWSRLIRDLRQNLPLQGSARVNANYIGGPKVVEDGLWKGIMRDVFGSRLLRKQDEWEVYLKEGSKILHAKAEEYFNVFSEILIQYGESRSTLTEMAAKSHRPEFLRDRLADLEDLVNPDCLFSMDSNVWKSVTRWMRGVEARARRGLADPGKDARAAAMVSPLVERLKHTVDTLSAVASAEKKNRIREARLMMEELKIACFAAGEVRGLGKISETRMKKFLDEIDRML